MAGLNVRTNFSPPQDFVLPLRELIKEGRIPLEIIDSRVSDILRVKFELGLFDNPYNQKPAEADELVANEDNIKIAKQTALESIVLLKNEEQILPIQKNKFKRILICGPNAKDISHSESRYGPSWLHFESVYEGIKNYVSDDTEVVYAQGCDFFDENWPLNELYYIEPDAKQQNMINEAVSLAQNADLIIVAVGDNEETVGESKSRTSLNLPGNQLDLLKALHKTGKPMVGILINGRPMSINWMDKYVPAIIEAWCPGPYGGSTLAKVIFGEYNPGGKLTVTFPKTVGQIPFNFPHKRSSQKEQDKPDKDYIGRTRINHALYPFGYGLSYTSFGYSNLIVKANKLTTDFDSIEVSCTIKNTGNYDGDEVIQLYIKDEYSSVVSYEKLLRGFSRVHLKKGEEKKIRFILTRKDFELLNENMERVVEKGSFKIMIGSSSEEIQLEKTITLN
jgi:beta-glucosidase